MAASVQEPVPASLRSASSEPCGSGFPGRHRRSSPGRSSFAGGGSSSGRGETSAEPRTSSTTLGAFLPELDRAGSKLHVSRSELRLSGSALGRSIPGLLPSELGARVFASGAWPVGRRAWRVEFRSLRVEHPATRLERRARRVTQGARSEGFRRWRLRFWRSVDRFGGVRSGCPHRRAVRGGLSRERERRERDVAVCGEAAAAPLLLAGEGRVRGRRSDARPRRDSSLRSPHPPRSARRPLPQAGEAKCARGAKRIRPTAGCRRFSVARFLRAAARAAASRPRAPGTARRRR